MKTIYICNHCGERMEGTDKEIKKYCLRCKTAEGRKKVDEENKELKNV